MDESERVQVIVIKGTSLATPIGSGPTATEDKFNDNMMFSCCCAKASWEWTPICDCPLSTKQCSLSCLLRESNFDKSYYNLAQTIYLAVQEWRPRTSIWMTGHSLGGALASLVALTNDLPAFAFEAPGDLMYASRLGLLPDLPRPNPGGGGSSMPNYTDFLSALPIYHFGTSQDPIFMGTCRGLSSSCYWFDYALESQCHTGYECTYEPTDKIKSNLFHNDSNDDELSASYTNIKYHSIDYVIKHYVCLYLAVHSE
jgi:lipase ATG15